MRSPYGGQSFLLANVQHRIPAVPTEHGELSESGQAGCTAHYYRALVKDALPRAHMANHKRLQKADGTSGEVQSLPNDCVSKLDTGNEIQMTFMYKKL